jgi:type I restriction enzyme M protein
MTNTSDPNQATPSSSASSSQSSDIVSRYASAVWATADVLRGVGAKGSEWPGHMMPFFALVLLESRALRARQAALAKFGNKFDPTDPVDVEDLKANYNAGGGAVVQTYHEDLVLHGQSLAWVVSGGPSGFTQKLRGYLAGFDAETVRLLGVDPNNSPKAYLNIDGTIKFLDGKGGEHLWQYCKDWAAVDLVDYNSSAITTLEEHIKRRWADISAETAGEHYTPADLIDLVAKLALSLLRRHPLKNAFLRIYDPTCGGGNMLFGVEDRLRAADRDGLLRNASGEAYSIESVGQEINDHLFALAAIEARFRPYTRIREGDTLANDQFTGERFGLIVANPPYGNDWKAIQRDIASDQTGRFPDGCRPPVSDGQHLFLQHIWSHLDDGGVAMVFCSGSTLFSGDAGGGESNARMKYVLTDEGVLGVIQLPKNEFFNTGINTYLWVFMKDKPEALKDRLFLLNAESLGSKLRKSLGSKNIELSQVAGDGIESLIRHLEEGETAQALQDGEGQGLTLRKGIPVVVPLKYSVAGEPVLLRLLKVDDVHYNKVSIQLTRASAHGAVEESFTVEPNDIQVDGCRVVNGTEPGEASQVLSVHLKRDVESDAKSIANAIKELLENGKSFLFMNSDSGRTYAWDGASKDLIEEGQPVGRAAVEVKVKAIKRKGETDRLRLSVSVGPDIDKDTETTPFSVDAAVNQAAIDAFLARWVKDKHTILSTVPGCEINFNRLFPKTGERKTLAQVMAEMEAIDAEIAALRKEGV